MRDPAAVLASATCSDLSATHQSRRAIPLRPEKSRRLYTVLSQYYSGSRAAQSTRRLEDLLGESPSLGSTGGHGDPPVGHLQNREAVVPPARHSGPRMQAGPFAGAGIDHAGP